MEHGVLRYGKPESTVEVEEALMPCDLLVSRKVEYDQEWRRAQKKGRRRSNQKKGRGAETVDVDPACHDFPDLCCDPCNRPFLSLNFQPPSVPILPLQCPVDTGTISSVCSTQDNASYASPK